MTVSARIILGPDGPSFLPTIDREAAEPEAALAGVGRIHEPREHEFGGMLIIGRNREIVVFDARILAKRPLERSHAAEEDQHASRQQPQLLRHLHALSNQA